MYSMKWLNALLYPFSLIYGGVMAIRNGLFDKGFYTVYAINKPSINVGNLSVGGTGKSPHVMYLCDLLKRHYRVATLSRGYGRKTKGFFEVLKSSKADQVGDEPLMFKLRMGEEVAVNVDEVRSRTAMTLDLNENVDVIVLDDAYQHRKVNAGFNLLLTEFNKPFFNDFVLPAGRLREFRCGKKRAQAIVVTKCPDDLTDLQKTKFKEKLEFDPNKIFFSKIVYGEQIAFGKSVEHPKSVLLVTGIAHPELLKKRLAQNFILEDIRYPDHHNFTRTDLAEIHAKFDKFDHPDAVIMTTEKDFVRILPLLTEDEKQKYPWYYQSITVQMDREEAFNELIIDYVRAIPTIG